MFVVQTHLGAISNLHINDSRFPWVALPKGRKNHSLECVCNPKGSDAYKNFLVMQTEKESMHATTVAKCAKACLKIKEAGTKKDVFRVLSNNFVLAHSAKEQGFYQQGESYQLFKALREVINLVATIGKDELEELNK